MATAEIIKETQFREIRLSRITVAPGFNPRGEVKQDEELEALAETIRARGCLQPIRVRESERGEFVLVAGERRYRAAAIARLTVVPATVLSAGAGDEAEQIELLSDAVIENELRVNLDPLQRARGYRAMLDGGLTVRGIAERLGGSSGRRGREQRVREHLAILELPVEIMCRVQAGEVPLMAVKSLLELASVHEQLASAAVAAVLDPGECAEPYSWSEIVTEGLAIAVSHIEKLPAGVFNSAQSYALGRFTLSEKATRDLASYERLTGGQITAVRFTAELIERARSLEAVHDCGWFVLVSDQEVADSLAEDYIASALKRERASRRRTREAGAGSGNMAMAGRGADGEPLTEDPQQHEDDEREQAQAAREAETERREQAARYNTELGVLAFKHLPKLKVDDRVLRILASVDLGGSLRQIAMLGARVAMPGWIGESERSSAKTKFSYPEDGQVAAKASEFLSGAQGASAVAGRAITLLALAQLADEEALPRSRRCWYSLTFKGPWAEEARSDLLEIVREQIKEGQLPALDERLSASDRPLVEE